MDAEQWKDYTNAELIQAEEARRAGNEGRARVCARRAAGHILDEYSSRKKVQFPNRSAYLRIKYLAEQPDITSQVRQILNTLVIRITPGRTIPVDADLIEGVYKLAIELLGEELQREKVPNRKKG